MTALERELEAIRLELDEAGRKAREKEAARAARRKRLEEAIENSIAATFAAILVLVFGPFILFWECLREKTFETLVTLALVSMAAFGWQRHRVDPHEAAYVYRSAFSIGEEEEVRCEQVTRFEARCQSAAHGSMRCRAAWDGTYCAR